VLGFSLNDVAGRLLARRVASAAELTSAAALIALPLGVLGMAVTGFVGIEFRHGFLADADIPSIWVAASSVFLIIVTNAVGGVLIRTGAMRWYFRAFAAGAVTQFLVTLALDAAGALSPSLALAAYAFSLLVTLILCLMAVAAEIGRAGVIPRFNPVVLRSFLRGSGFLHVTTLGNYLNLRLDLLLVGALASARQAGLYSVSTALAGIGFTAFETLSLALAHPVTQADDDDAVRQTVEFIQRSWILIGAATALTAAIAYPIVRLLYGSNWTGSVLPLLILIVAGGAVTMGGIFHLALLRFGRPRGLAIASVAAAAVNLGANVLLIPVAGIAGAALASVVSYWLLAIILARMFLRATSVDGAELLHIRVPTR
jgi:O-antigen/teichoic acid export membrane protein